MPLQLSARSTSAPMGNQVPSLRDDILSLVHRATFGYTTEEHARARAMGFDAWRDEQLNPATIDDSAMDALLASLPSLTLSGADLIAMYPTATNGHRIVSGELRAARYLRAAFSKRQLLERMVEFWTDHFNINGNDDLLYYLKTVDDREVIRTHALGNFRDLLGASAMSGAMLFYLDNYVNVAAAPNENYARELMELHTLGASGGYDEFDVVAVARCLTGWSIHGPNRPNTGEFLFRSAVHDNGSKTVISTFIPAGGGQTDGETVLDILANHTSTAARLARKLCVFFLAYDPPMATVDRVAATFTSSGGNIAETVREVLSKQSFEETQVWQELKLRRPLHLAIGALRSTGATVASTDGLNSQLRLMGHVPFAWPAPNGYPDAIGAWGSSLLPRWGFTTALLHGQVAGLAVPTSALLALLNGAPSTQAAAAFNRGLTGGRMSPLDVQEVQQFIDAHPVWNGNVAREAVALALSLPSTQWI